MAFTERSLDDYVDVSDRIQEFYARYKSGSLQPADPAHPWELATVTGYDKNGEQIAQTFVVYVAAAYRDPEDTRPGIGAAWEIWPGRTPYTRGSELQNAETSAWGRAIAALGIATKKGIASRQEVENRRAEREDGLPTNRDGSLSRSRTTDAEKDAAGVMTSAQQAEHTALQPKRRETRGRVTRIEGVAGTRPAANQIETRQLEAKRAEDPWQDQPAGSLPREQENEPGTILPGQQRKIHAACTGMERPARLATISDIVGRQVTSSNELSYTEAAKVLEKLSGVRP